MTTLPPEDGDGEHPIDVDSEFAKIIADFGERPDASILDDVSIEPDPEPREIPASLFREVPPIEDEHVADGDPGHFVPPEPDPIPMPEPIRLFAWIGLFGGPITMLLLLIFGFYTPPWLGALLALAFVGGFVTLVFTMPPRDDDDPWDSSGGAVL